MRKWDDYKDTMAVEPSVYQSARDGLISEVELEINQGLPTIHSLDAKNAKGHSLLMLAAYNNQFELTKKLIEAGSDVNSLDNSGNSILMGAAFKGYTTICELLVEHQADVHYKNSQGQSALDFAHMFGRTEVVAFLSKINSKKYEPIKGFFKSWTLFATNLSRRA